MKRSFLFVFSAALAMGCATTSTNTDTETVTTKQVEKKAPVVNTEIPDLTWDQVKTAVANGAVLVDARKPSDYAQGHIDGAVNSPATDATALSNLPKGVHLIFYGAGITSKEARQSAERAQAAGFDQVSEFSDGYPGWLMAL